MTHDGDATIGAASPGDPGPPGSAAPEERVRVRLDLGGVALAFAGRRTFFERHVAPLLEAMYRRAGVPGEHPGMVPGAAAPREPAGPPPGAVFQPSSPQRFQQFAGQVGASAATVEQRAMAFAFYLWNYERQDAFDPDEIAAFFRTVHEEPPDTLPGMLEALATTRRWLEPAADVGAWRLTTKGVNYVKNRLLGDL